MQELVGPGDHAVVTVPCYQAMETVTVATGADVSAWVPRRENGWALDLDELRALLRPTTKLVAVNFPNNPTGYVPDEATFRELVDAVRRARHPPLLRRGVPRYRGRPGAGRSPRRPTSPRRRSRSTSPPSPTACRACASGWLACRDRALLERLEKRKHYTSICNAGPAEYLAAVALRNREAHLGAQPRHRRGQSAALRRLLRSLVGALRLAAAGGRLRLLPPLQGRRRRGVLREAARRGGRAGPAGEHVLLGDRRSPHRPLPCRNRQAGPRRRPRRPSTASCGHRTKFAARG